jgi:hypothetical protein
MESRTDNVGCRIGNVVPPYRYQRAASARPVNRDRCTPAQAREGSLSIRFVEAMPGSTPAERQTASPPRRGEVCLAQPSPPDRDQTERQTMQAR